MTKIQVNIPDELMVPLKERAEAEDRSVAATIRVALRHYLGTNNPPASAVPIRSLHIPNDNTDPFTQFADAFNTPPFPMGEVDGSTGPDEVMDSPD